MGEALAVAGTGEPVMIGSEIPGSPSRGTTEAPREALTTSRRVAKGVLTGRPSRSAMVV